MAFLKRNAFWLIALALMASTAAGCGGDGPATTSSSTRGDTTGVGGAGGAGGAGGGGVGGGGTGGSGSGGGSTGDKGHPATETVTAGTSAKSPNYIMVFTFGQPTQNQDQTTSPSYKLRGGLAGANGSAP